MKAKTLLINFNSRKIFSKTLALLLFFTFFSTLTAQGQTLDQSNFGETSAGQIIVLPSYTDLGQSFMAGLTGALSSVEVEVNGTSPFYPTLSGDFILTVFQGDGYGGSVLGTATINVPVSFEGNLTIPITSVNVTSGTIYTFKIAPAPSSSGRIMLNMSNNVYANGILYNGTFGPTTNYDLKFKTYITSPPAASALDFDGANDYVYAGNIMPATYTKEAWFYVSNLGIQNNLISGGNDGQHALYPSTNWGNRISAGHNGTWNAVQDPTPIVANTWYHVALTYDAATTTMKLYKNGVLVSTNTNVTPFVGGNALRIGAFDNAQNLLGGKMDEVRIWNRALNQCEIQNNMNGELSSGQTGLLAYYQFNQGIASADNTAITSLTDSSGNNNNGTLNNFALTGATSNWITPGGVTTGTTSPTYLMPNVNAITNQSVCNNSAITAIIFSSSTTGTLCGQTNEGGNITLTAPVGAVFTSIPFASYGTPNGSCGNYTLGGCHASNSSSIVSGLAIGQNNFSIGANNATFGDPCAFTAKHMYIEAIYNNTIFNWTNDTPSIGLSASGTGNIPSFTAVNTGSTPVVATITVTPMIDGCAGTPIQFTITVNPTAATPTGSSTQVINGGVAADATIEDIDVNPTTVSWYASSSDALAGTNALLAGTQLIDGAEYFAINQENGCSSAPLAVTVTVVLGNDAFDMNSFNLYPNPTSDFVTLQYSNEITEISVLNLLGQMMLNKKLNATETTIDFSNFPAATYFVKIVSEGKTKTVKVIKK